MSNTEWRHIGDVSVDSGTVWIGDPCYIVPESKDEELLTWEDWCADKGSDSAKEMLNGLWSDTCYGDGIYPVYAEYLKDDKFNRPLRITIELNPEGYVNEAD